MSSRLTHAASPKATRDLEVEDGDVEGRFRVGVEAFLSDGHSGILLGLRKNAAGAGTWGLPGGHLRVGEELRAALRRELLEELGISVRRSRLACVVDDPTNGGGHYLHFGFAVDTYDGQLEKCEPDKCEDWRFFHRDQLPTNLFPPHVPEIDNFFKEVFYKHERAHVSGSDLGRPQSNCKVQP